MRNHIVVNNLVKKIARLNTLRSDAPVLLSQRVI